MGGGEQSCSVWSKDKPWWSNLKFNWVENDLRSKDKPWWSDFKIKWI